MIHTTFEDGRLPSGWQTMEIGDGRVTVAGGRCECRLPAHDNQAYHNAQLDDYQGLRRRDFPWHPPLTLTVRARTSHPAGELRGTAGFGFWNHPFMPGGGLPRLPGAVWFFFASPPSDMALAQGVPGHGWKAATFDARTLTFGALLPFAPLGFLLMRIPALYRRLWPLGQRAIKVSERPLDAVTLDEPHTYRLDWQRDAVTFAVDGQTVHHAPVAPRGPLGFVTWLDNQYAVVTPQGRFQFGFVERSAAQALVLEEIRIVPGAAD